MKKQLFLTAVLSVLALNAAGQNCTITLQSGSSNTTACISSPITDIVYNTGDGATGIVSCTPLPAGITAVWEAAQSKVRISGTPSESGVFDYTLILTGGGGCSTTGTITVYPLPQGTLTGNGPLCPGGSPELTWNASAGTGPYTIIYKENGGTNRTKTGVVSGTPFTPHTTTINTSFTYTVVSVEDETTSCIRTSGFTGSSVTITVNPRPQGSVSVNGPFCGSGTPLLVWNASAGTGPYTIKYTENNGPERTATGVASGVGFTPFTSPVTADTDYEITSVQDETTSCIRTSGFTDATASVDIRPLPADNLPVSGPGAVCTGSPATITVGSTQSGVRYQLRDDSDNSPIGSPVNGSGGSISLPAGTITSDRTFNVLATNTTTGCESELTDKETVTVNDLPQGSLSANGPFCGSGTGQLTFTATAGTGPFTVVYNDGTGNRTASGVVSGAAFDVSINPVSATTVYTLVSVSDASCTRNSGFTGPSATITVYPLPQGSLTGNGPFCGSGTGRLTWTASSGTGPYSLVYNDGTADRTKTGVLSGVAFDVFANPVSATTNYTLVSVTDAHCTRNSGFTSGTAVITVNPFPEVSLAIGGTGSVCTGTGTSITIALSQAGVQYQLRNDAGNIPVGTPVAGNGGTINLPTGNLVSSTTFNVLATYSATGCNVEMNELETVTVNPLPQGSLSANGPFCGSGSGQLTFTATTGTGPYTIVYSDGVANRTAGPVNSGTPFDVFTLPVIASTTYTLVSVTDANCTRSSGFTTASATITVYPLPQGSLTANGPFCDTGTGRITWTASAGTGPFTVVYNDGVTNHTRSSVVSGVPFDAGVNPVTATTTYSLVSVTDVHCTRTSGFTGPAATITVNYSPAVITGVPEVCQDLTTTLANATPGGVWSSLNTSVAQIDAAGIVTGKSGGSAEIRYTIAATTCFRSANVTVHPTPVVTSPSSANVCTGTSTSINMTATVPCTFTWTIGTITGGVTGASPGAGTTISQSLVSPDPVVPGTVEYLVTPVSVTGTCTGLPYSIIVKVNPLPRLTGASQSLTVCSGSQATINLLGLLPGTTSTISYEINNISQPPVTGVVSNSSGIASFSTVPLGFPNNGQLLRITGVTTTSYTPSCYQGFVQDLALGVDPVSVGGSVVAVAPICSGETPADLNLTGVTGFIVKWQKSSDAGFASPIDIPFPTSPLTGLAIGPLNTTTYFRAVVRSGVCPESTSAGTQVTVNPLPAPAISGPASVNVGTSGHVYTTAAGMSNYDWSVSPGGTITSGAGTSSVTVAWNAGGTQYARVNYRSASGCSAASPATFNVAVNSRPVAVGVTILGEPRSKLVLTGTFLYTDPENDPVDNASLVYQWYTASDQTGTGSAPISGANSVSYLVRDADLGKYIGFSVIPAAVSGATPGAIAITANWAGPVDNEPPKANSVSILGSLTVGLPLTGWYSYYDREGDVEQTSLYQWFSSDSPVGPFAAITGETNTTHLIAENEQGKYFRFSVIPRAASGRSPGSEVIVTTTGRVNSRPYANNIIVKGFPGIDSVLTATWSYNDIDSDAPGTSTYRWLRDGTDPIAGATGLTYKATSADEGRTIVFEVTPVAATGLSPGTAVKSSPTSPVIDASGSLPSAQEVCIQGNRRTGALLTGKYHYEFYKSESGSTYRWLRNGVPIPGATGTGYTLTADDIARGVDIAFEVTPRSSNYIPKTGPPATSPALSRIKLEKTAYSIADPPFKLEANVPGGFFQGTGVVGENYDPEVADTLGSPHKITYLVTVTNTITVCPQQAYDSIYVFPIDPYFVGLDTLYCHYDSPVTVTVANIPRGAKDFVFSSPNPNIFTTNPGDTSVVIDPSGKGKDPRELLKFSFTYKDAPFDIKKEFEIVYLQPAKIALDPGSRFCNGDLPVKLYPSPSGSEGTGMFTGPVTGDSFDPLKGKRADTVTYVYTDTRSKCFSSVSVPVIINPSPKPAFAPVSTCIATVNKDITEFSNKTKTEDPVASWDWKFYDGGGYGASTLEKPGYAFRIGGQHRVTLTATTINNCSATKDSTIDIGIRPVIGFTWKNECFKENSSDGDSLIWFYDNSVAPSEIRSWRWSFNGGSPVFNDTASFRKTSSGVVRVNYQVETNYAGCGASVTRDVFIRPTRYITSAPYAESFANGKGGWEIDYSAKNSWEFGTPDRSVIKGARTDANAWFTNYPLTGQTPENSAVISPCFRMDSVTRPMIAMWTWKRFDRDRDGAVLQYQIGDTSVWRPVGTLDDDGIRWYNSALITGNPGGRQIGWTAGTGNTKDAEWVESRHVLDELAGVKKDVKFRIAYGSDGTAKNNDGIAFDDIWIGERTRGVLLEHFTNSSSLSPNSAIADLLINTISGNRNKDIINIQYHTNFPGTDPYYSDNPGDASARFLFYGLSRAPFSMTDGGTDPLAYAAGFNYQPLVELDTLKIIRRSLINPLFRISLDVTVSGGLLEVEGEIKAVTSIANAENITLYIAVTEKASYNAQLPGGPWFYNVFRKFIPDPAGIPLKRSWSEGDEEAISRKSWTIEKIKNNADIEVIAFIQNNVTKVVYQAEAESIKNVAVGIEDSRHREGKGFAIYPNPASSRLNIVFEEPLKAETDIRIFDFSGNLVRHYRVDAMRTDFSIEDISLKNGIYLVRVTSGSTDAGFKKLIVSGR